MLNTASFHITNKCNGRCLHCFVEAEEKKIKEMTTQQAYKFISEFAECTNNSGRLNIYGGEPLVRDDIFDIITIAKDKKLKVEIATSGIVPVENIKNLIKTKPDYICCDLDGGNSESHDWLRNYPGHFMLAKDLIREFVNSGIHTSVVMVAHKRNRNEMIKFLDICQELNISIASFLLFSPSGRGKKIKELVIEPDEWLESHDLTYEWYYKNHPNFDVKWQIAYKKKFHELNHSFWDCTLNAIKKFFIRCDGNIYSCPLLAGSKYCFGNINKEPLNEILKRREKNSFLTIRGCPGMAYHVYGDPNKCDPRNESLGIIPTCPRETELWTCFGSVTNFQYKKQPVNPNTLLMEC